MNAPKKNFGPRPLVEVEGLGQLRRTLRQAGKEMTAKLKDANAEAAAHVAAAARQSAPVLTGALRNSIRSTGQQRYGVVRAGKAKIPYANPINWGWPARNIERNPFLTGPARRTEHEWLPIYFNHIRDILDQVQGD